MVKLRKLIGPDLAKPQTAAESYVITQKGLDLLPPKARDFIWKKALETKNILYPEALAKITLTLEEDLSAIAREHNESIPVVIGTIAGLINQARRQPPSLPKRINELEKKN